MFLRGLAVFVVLGFVFASDVLAQKPAIGVEEDYGLPANVVVLSELTGCEEVKGLYPIVLFSFLSRSQATIRKQFCYRGEDHEERLVLLTLHNKRKKLVTPGLVGIIFGDRVSSDPNSGKNKYVDRWVLINHGVERNGEFNRRWSTFVPESDALNRNNMSSLAVPLFVKLCRHYHLRCPSI